MGLDAFKTDDSSDDSPEEHYKNEGSELELGIYDDTDGCDVLNVGSNDSDDTILGIDTDVWLNMTNKERVLAVRQTKFPDFKPSMQLDERWKSENKTEIECVCNNQMTFSDMKECNNCGRQYKEIGRTVTKIKDPHDDLIYNNATTE